MTLALTKTFLSVAIITTITISAMEQENQKNDLQALQAEVKALKINQDDIASATKSLVHIANTTRERFKTTDRELKAMRYERTATDESARCLQYALSAATVGLAFHNPYAMGTSTCLQLTGICLQYRNEHKAHEIRYPVPSTPTMADDQDHQD